MTIMRAVLAHQGGWDELAYLVVPAVLGILALRWAEKRAIRRRTDEEDTKPDNNEKTNHRSQP